MINWFGENPIYLSLICLVWLLLWGAGKIQFHKNIQYLRDATSSVTKQLISEGKEVNIHIIYQTVYQQWQQRIEHLSWFIPHRYELWPIPAKIEELKNRIGFSPEWVEEFLTTQDLINAKGDPLR